MRLNYVRLQQFWSADDPIPRGNDPEPPPAPAGASGLTCEFCECTLAKNGDVIKVGRRAKKMRDLEDEIEGRDATIAERDTEIATLKREIADLKAQQPKAKSGSAWGG